MGKTILLLDDDREFRRLMLPMLQARGHRVIEAGKATEADAALRTTVPDLMVVDGLLPGIDGATWIGQLPPHLKKVPVVFISAFWRSLKDHQRLTDKLGVSLVVHKPVSPAVLAEQVEGLLGGSDPAPAAALPPETAQMIEQLRAEYAKELPAKIETLATALLAARAAPADLALRGEARMLAHRLAGTAGAYGFAAVGDTASTLEHALVAFSEQEAVAPAAFLPLQATIEALRALAKGAPNRGLAGEQVRSPQTRFLVVDDDPSVLDLLQHLGEQQALEVLRARNSQEALALAARSPPDAVILDVGLEEGKSFQLARELRSMPGLESLPLAFMSSDAGPENRIAAAHAGASLFLAKPLAAQNFAAAVRQLAAQRDAARPRAMVVDDDPIFLAQISAVLRSDGMLVTKLSDGSQILEALAQNRPDVLLLDVLMPGFSGFDLCRMLRTTPEWQDLPILFITATSTVEARIAAFQARGDDFLQKPVVREELLARVRVRIERQRLMREKNFRDSLTGVLLRRAFVETVEARIAEAKRRTLQLGVAILDLDDFKRVNDRHGHLAADRVLAQLGALMNTRFRAEDVRGRWGGEEFVLGIAGEGAEMTQRLVERLLNELAAVEFKSDRGEPFRVSFTAGVASYPDDGQCFDELLRLADRRLLAAKHAGKARVGLTG